MSDLRFYAVVDAGVQELEVPEGAADFVDLYEGLSLGTYSALRTFEHNKFLRLAWHIERTKLSMDLMAMDYALDEERLRKALDEVVTSYPAENARVRFDVLMEPGTAVGTASRELIAVKPFIPVPDGFYKEGVGVGYAPTLQRELARAKTAEFAEQRHGLAPGKEQGLFEFLILDDRGYILEGTMTNFWAVRDGEVWTAGEGMLEGITRKIILSLLPELGIPVHFEAIHRDDIATLDEAGISGSSRAVVPVAAINGEKVGIGKPGSVIQRILAAYQEYVAGEVRRAVPDK